MEKRGKITHLFLDIGGVLLTNGWDSNSRRLAAKNFQIDFDEFEARHRLNFGVMEEGKLSLEEYLRRVVFYKPRSFSLEDFRRFIFSQSEPLPQMLELFFNLKEKYGLKIAAVSNETREINAYRIQTFRLDRLIDSFISSCYVGIRKPDTEMYRLALDVSQATADRTVYIENTPLFVEIAESLGIAGILHQNYEATCTKLAAYNLTI